VGCVGGTTLLSRLGPKRLCIPAGARVLEIGSGSRPHPRTTVLTDLLATDVSQREGRALVRDGRPFVVANGEALPFRSGAFDYCIASHVLEHADDAARMICEMQRVARAGYIETPTELRDWLCSVPPYTEIHKWFVNCVGNELVLTRKTAANSRHRLGALLDYLRHEDPWFERWIERSPHLFVVQHEWRGTIGYRIEAESPLQAMCDGSTAAGFAAPSISNGDFYWGTGPWGFKRWLYARWVHPVWRKRAKRLLAPLRGGR
jgi:SAM-dependent methyltransferase